MVWTVEAGQASPPLVVGSDLEKFRTGQAGWVVFL